MNKGILLILCCLISALTAKEPIKAYIRGNNFFAELNLGDQSLKIDLVESTKGEIFIIEITNEIFKKDFGCFFFQNIQELFDELKVSQVLELTSTNQLKITIKAIIGGKTVDKTMNIPLSLRSFKTDFQKTQFILLLSYNMSKKQGETTNKCQLKADQSTKQKYEVLQFRLQALQKASQKPILKEYFGYLNIRNEHAVARVNQILIKINFQHMNLKKPPYVFTAIFGESHHWMFDGISSIYNLTNSSCVVPLRHTGPQPITSLVKRYNYELQYFIKERADS